MPADRIGLSLILPAYNEGVRLPPYLTAVRSYLDGQFGQPYEVIIVDDGSRPRMCDFLQPFTADWPQLRVLEHARNQGKGAAVRTGMLAARGDLLLFADADGATPIEEQRRLSEAIEAGADLAVGSRLLPGEEVRRSRSRLRGAAGVVFAAVARALLGLSIRDPQCGFKMFRAEVGRRLFSETRESRFLFDLELLATAQRLGYRTTEVPISWREVPGGHFHPFRQLPTILTSLWRLRRRLGKVPRQADAGSRTDF